MRVKPLTGTGTGMFLRLTCPCFSLGAPWQSLISWPICPQRAQGRGLLGLNSSLMMVKFGSWVARPSMIRSAEKRTCHFNEAKSRDAAEETFLLCYSMIIWRIYQLTIGSTKAVVCVGVVVGLSCENEPIVILNTKQFHLSVFISLRTRPDIGFPVWCMCDIFIFWLWCNTRD